MGFLDGFRIVFYINVDPHQARNAKDVHKVDDQKHDERTEGHRLAVTQYPVKQSDKKQAEPAAPHVGNKHGAVIITGLREIVEVALGAALQHVERFDKRPTAGFKHLPFVATRAFQIKNTVRLGTF